MIDTSQQPRVLVDDAEPSGVHRDACGHHGCVHETYENVLTAANALTLLRTAGCLAAATVSIATGQVFWLFVGLAVHCVGDVADGILARAMGQETRAGAVLDVVSDRLCIATYYLSYGQLHHELLLPIALFLFQFMVLDAYLSLVVLDWPLLSLNYFGLVDRSVYRWNWSPVGKALNSGGLVVLMLTTQSAVACTALVLLMLGVKTTALVRVHRRGVPAPVGCAARMQWTT